MANSMLQLLAFGMSLLLATTATAGTHSIQGRYAGTAHQTGLDADGDGEVASAVQSSGPSSVGRTSNEAITEFHPWDGVTFCGPTHILLNYRYFEGSHQAADGSAYFLSFRSGTLCFDFTTGHYSATVLIDVVGGTNRFEGASGEVTFELHSDKPVVNGFSAFSGTFEGRLTLP